MSRGLRLLVLTQAVDMHDPVLGFFTRWIAALARECEHIDVVALRVGTHELPENVSVHSLGKESKRSRISYIARFFYYALALRKRYDSVFVHMNAEYAVLGGFLWRSMGKRIVLWRNHKVGGAIAWLGALLSHVVLYTSPASYVARFKKARLMPIGIDTAHFSPGATPSEVGVLFFGRLDEIKRPHVFLEALALLQTRGIRVQATLGGAPTRPESSYVREVNRESERLEAMGFLTRTGSVKNSDAVDLYRSHAIYVNLTPSGSFDKTIGEAAASGCIVVAANEVLRGIVPETLVVESDSAQSVANGIEAALSLDEGARNLLSQKLRAFVEERHSLTRLTRELIPVLSPAL